MYQIIIYIIDGRFTSRFSAKHRYKFVTITLYFYYLLIPRERWRIYEVNRGRGWVMGKVEFASPDNFITTLHQSYVFFISYCIFLTTTEYQRNTSLYYVFKVVLFMMRAPDISFKNIVLTFNILNQCVRFLKKNSTFLYCYSSLNLTVMSLSII